MQNKQLIDAFTSLFGVPAQGLSIAPGRVNLIGEHTDYNQGLVLPCALEFSTKAVFSLRQDNRVEVYSQQYPDQKDIFDVNDKIVAGDSHWGNYVRAVVYALQQQGLNIGGLNLLIDSDVPQGAGLSSSAALEVSIVGAFNYAYQLALDDLRIAQLGQQAENEFMGCNCGIMDQLISVKGAKNNALLIDCKALSTRLVSIPDYLSLLIIDSNHPHSLVDSEYNQRRADCMSAADKMQKSSLREVDLDLLSANKEHLTGNEYKRAEHVITENARVEAALNAMSDGDTKALSIAMAESHQSLKHNYEVTVPATDWLVDTISNVIGFDGGVRMTGGGFGGSVICLCPHSRVTDVKQAIELGYQEATGLNADVYLCKAGEGLKVLSCKQ